MAEWIYCCFLCMWHPPRLWFNPCSCTFFYIIIVTKANIGIRWNLLECVGIHWNSRKYGNSNGFQHIPTDSNGNHSWRLPDSNWFHWIPSDSVGNSMEWKTKMAEAPAKWILSEFHGIPTFQSESGGFRQNSWGRVKTSSIAHCKSHEHCNHAHLVLPSYVCQAWVKNREINRNTN